ncbi:hypothetical protein PLACP1_02840 [Planifilum fimeticola]
MGEFRRQRACFSRSPVELLRGCRRAGISGAISRDDQGRRITDKGMARRVAYLGSDFFDCTRLK